MRNLKTKLDAQSPKATATNTLKEEQTPPSAAKVNLTQDIIMLSSRPGTKLTMESDKKKEVTKKKKIANTHRIKIIDGELP